MISLIIISHPELLPGEAGILQQLFERGLEYFHLRKPGVGEDTIRQLLSDVPEVYRSRIALHSHHYLADEFGLRRLHFTEQHRQASDLATFTLLKEKGFSLTTSVHSVQALQQLPSVFLYAFLGPVFNSISKQGYQGITDGGFYIPAHQKPVLVIALGGIQAHNINTVYKMGFDGAAVLGAIWNQPEKAITILEDLQCRQQDLMF